MKSHTVSPCIHDIKILNFSQNELVYHQIIRLVGTTKTSKTSCGKEDQWIVLSLKEENVEIKQCPVNNEFNFLIKLREGCNILQLIYGCKVIEVKLEYVPIKSECSVMLLYVICEGHDGLFQAPPDIVNDADSACKRILLCSKLLQCFTAEKLLENGLGRKTFSLDDKCHIFKCRINYEEARKMNQQQLWKEIGRDIMTSPIGSEKKKYLAFLSCTWYNGDQYTDSMRSHEEFLKITDAYVALGGGGLALFGTACLYTWPENFKSIISCFKDNTLVDRHKFLDDSCYRRTRGACFSTTLGSVLHELYHTFDLAHTKNGIMGRGFDNIQKFFTLDDQSYRLGDRLRTSQDHIEFREEFHPHSSCEKQCKDHSMKEIKIISKFKNGNGIYLSKSCAVLLYYHKWFNTYSATATYLLSYDPASKFIKSTGGIRVVEIRNEQDGLIAYSWTFEKKVLKFSFCIPNEVFMLLGSYVLFVEDNNGSILKQNLRKFT